MNSKKVIEPAFKHFAIGNVEVRNKQINNKLSSTVQVTANFGRYPIKFHKAATEQQSVGTTEENDSNKINKAKAVYNKCVQVLNKMGFPEEQ
ncbi:MAG: hypothetical protein MRJ93_05240 [Nitrososphaeraceae archaeon]|nr:hypothetical protein [Nitrososphaeraceae archaeon]